MTNIVASVEKSTTRTEIQNVLTNMAIATLDLLFPNQSKSTILLVNSR